MTWQAPTKASISALPEAPSYSATAIADGASIAPGWTPAPSLRSESSSKACASAPLASAAKGACTLAPGRPRMVERPPQSGAEDAGADGVDDAVAGVRPHLGGDVV